MRRAKAISLLLALLLSLAACSQAPLHSPVPAQSAAPAQSPLAQGVPAGARVLFINVGKADATLLQGDGYAYLVDTGTKSSVPALFGALNAMGVARLDGVIFTHTHNDHTGGARALCAQYPTARLYCAEITQLDKNGKNSFETLSAETGVPLTKLRAGDTLPMGAAKLDVLGPLVANAEDDNDQSLVLRFSAYKKTLLLTGDMQFAEEETLLTSGVDLSADLLKVGNHGNPDATSDAFAQAVSPSVAVISTDTREDTDSANPRVYAALEGAAMYRTEDTAAGVLATLSPTGEMTMGEVALAPVSLSLRIREIDKAAQTAVICNQGEAQADLSGCMLYSAKGDELFIFPAGTVLAPSACLTVGCEGGAGDLLWPGETKVWKKNKADVGRLFDRYGRLLDSLDA